MDKEDMGQYNIQNHLEGTRKKSVQFSVEENSKESTENSQSNVDYDIKERILLVIMKLGVKLKYKDDKKYIEEELEKTVALV